MMRLMLSLLLTTLVGCQSKPKEDKPKAPPTAFERDLDRMCNVLSFSGALELQPGERAMHVGIWLAQNMESKQARELSAELTQLEPAPRIKRMQEVLAQHGISQCPTVQTW